MKLSICIGRNFRKIGHRSFWETISIVFKFIDAKEDLSIQLHPNDALAKSTS